MPTWSRIHRANTPAARRKVPNNGVWAEVGGLEEEEEEKEEQVANLCNTKSQARLKLWISRNVQGNKELKEFVL